MDELDISIESVDYTEDNSEENSSSDSISLSSTDMMAGYEQSISFSGTSRAQFDGTAGDDTFTAVTGNNRYVGGTGSDTVDYSNTEAGIRVYMDAPTAHTANGFGGGDILDSIENIIGGDYNDTIYGDNNANILSGGAGNDVIRSGNGGDTLNGGDGNDHLTGGTGNDTYDGGIGNDILIAGDGTDSYDGGDGFDTLNFAVSGATNRIWIDLGAGIIYDNGLGETSFSNRSSVANIENVIGTSYGDSITLGSGNEYAFGGDGGDTLRGGAGDDILYGEAGNDSFYGGAGNDVMYGGDGTIDTVYYSDALTGIRADFSGSSFYVLDGQGGVDRLFDIEHIYGSDFDDFMIGSSGRDNLHGDEGRDILKGGDERDYLWGGDGNDSLWGQGGNDVLYGGNGNDIMVASAGGDFYDGGSGVDTINYAVSGATQGVVVNYETNQTVNDGFGGTWGSYTSVEQIIGTEFGDYFIADVNNSFLRGNGGNDTLVGNDGTDYLYGGDGQDVLGGREGIDYLYGGADGDMFYFEYAFRDISNIDHIADFNVAEGDSLHLGEFLTSFNAGSDDITDFVRFVEIGSHSFIEVNDTGNVSSGSNFTVGRINNVTGLDVATLYGNGDIIVA